MKAFLVIYAATGMIVSYGLGYEMMYRDLVAAEKKTIELTARNVELVKSTSHDRYLIRLGLKECLVNQEKMIEAIEDIQQQMNVVIEARTGRERAQE
jgi:hypothetical protein